MKIKVLQENLTKALTISSRFASTKVQLPVLANVMLSVKKNSLLVSATNLESSIALSVGAKVDKEGSITVPIRTMNDLVSNLSVGQISLQTEKEQLKISTQNTSSVVSGMNASDFPKVPQKISKISLKLAKDLFLTALSQVLFSVSIDETRPVLTGVLMILKDGDVVFVSTDGFRLSQKKIKAKFSGQEKSLIIPRNALSELARLISEEDQIGFFFNEKENQVVFSVDSAVLASRVIEGEFPDFERIIPKESKIKLSLDKEELLQAVKLASVFARDAANVVKLGINKDSLGVSSESSRGGSQKTHVDAKVEGDKFDKKGFAIAFNYRFLEEFLNAVKGEEVQIELSDANAPGVFLDPKDSNFLHIIMPVKIQS
jgi:DNA polymerase-3 subunit beta